MAAAAATGAAVDVMVVVVVVLVVVVYNMLWYFELGQPLSLHAFTSLRLRRQSIFLL